jgi:hypothetical protein
LEGTKNIKKNTNNNTIELIKKLAEREGMNYTEAKETIKNSFVKTYCQGENSESELHFNFDPEFEVYRVYKIVDEVKDSQKEISKNNSVIKNGEIKGDKFFLPLNTNNFEIPTTKINELKKQVKKDFEKKTSERRIEDYNEIFENKELVEGFIRNSQEDYYLVELSNNVIAL